VKGDCSAGVGRTGTIIGSYLAKHLLTWSPHKKSSVSQKNLPLEITHFQANSEYILFWFLENQSRRDLLT
jgi:protein-tyrosine phosphatase